MEQDKPTITIAHDQYGKLALSVDGFLNNLAELFDDTRHVFNIETGELSKFVTKYVFSEKPNDDSVLIVRISNKYDDSHFIEREISTEYLAKLIANSRSTGIYPFNQPTFFEELGKCSDTLLEEQYPELVALGDILDYSNSIVFRNDAPIMAVRDTGGQSDNFIFYILRGAVSKEQDPEEVLKPEIFFDFSISDHPDFKDNPLWYSPYSHPESVLTGFTVEDEITQTGSYDNEDTVVSIVIYSRLHKNKVFKISGTLSGIVLENLNLEVMSDYRNTKDFMFDNYNNLNAIYDYLIDNTTGSSGIINELDDFLD